MAHVAGKIAAQVLGQRQFLVLLLEQLLLFVDAFQQRVHFLVYLVFQRVGEVERIDGLHDALRERFGQQEHQHRHHHERHQDGRHHAAQKREQALARFRKADDAAVLQFHGGIHRVGLEGFGVAHHRTRTFCFGLEHLGSFSMVLHDALVGCAVEQDCAVLRDKRVPHQASELLFQRRHVVRGGRRVQIGRRAVRQCRQFGFGIPLVGIIDGRHGHAERQDKGEGEHEHAREDLARQALDAEVRGTHAAAPPRAADAGVAVVREVMMAAWRSSHAATVWIQALGPSTPQPAFAATSGYARLPYAFCRRT